MALSVVSCGIFGGGSGDLGHDDVSGGAGTGDGGDYIVSGTEGLKYELNADGKSYTVIGMEEYANANNIIIPEKYNGLPVTAIGEKAFYESKKIMSVDLPDTITSIGENAFNSCTRLMTMEIPKSMTDGSVARGCSTLSSDDSCIGEDAFAGCENLVEVVNNSELNIVAGSEDYGEVALNAIEVHDGESKITHVGDYRFYSFAGKNYLVSYYGDDTNLVLPESFNGESYIVNDAVFCFRDNITSVVIPDSVTAIGDDAFNYCINLKSITFGKNVESVGMWAFNMCEKIESVYISNVAAWCSIDFSQPILGDGVNLYLKDGEKSALLTNLVIPEGVAKIGVNAFHGCMSIESVVIPDSVTSIGDRAFMSCYNIKSISFGEGVESIGDAAFYGAAITELVIPDSVKSIADDAFNWCQSLESVSFGEGVEGIGMQAFFDTAITELVIPESVSHLGDRAFSYCKELKSVELAANLTSVGENVFNGCEKLESVVIHDGVTSIGDEMFFGSADIKKIVIPASVTYIGEGAFWYSYEADVYISDIAAWCNIDFVDGLSGNLYLKNGEESTLVTHLVIPDGVTEINRNAFGGFGSVDSVTIPASVTRIGEGGLPYATKIYISDIADWCNIDFENESANPSTAELYLKNGSASTLITNLVIPEGVTKIKNYAFQRCESLTSVTIPATVTYIGDSAFAWCGLDSVVIPDSVTSIGEYAFWGCSKLASVTIGKGVTSIGYKAFTACDKLASITVDPENTSYKSIDGNLYKVNADGTSLTLVQYSIAKQDTTFAIPDGVTSIGGYAFRGDRHLDSVVIPDSVRSIDEYAFEYCNIESLVIGKGLSDISATAFSSCIMLSSITVSEENPVYKSVGGCLCKVNSDGTLTLVMCLVGKLGEDDTSFTTPDGVSAIADYAFSGCCNLTSVVIGDSVRSIGEYAFDGCNSLTSVVVGNGVTTICANAFYGCSELESVVLANSVTTIGEGAFMHCGKLASINIPDSVTTIGEYAFYGCSSLTTLVTGKGVTSIGKFAFGDCVGLTSVTLYGNGASIGEDAFTGCTALTTLVIGEGVTSIDIFAFSYCESLVSVEIGADLRSVARAAFAYCDSLTSVYITDLAAWCNIVFETSSSNPLHAQANLYLKDGEESTLITNLVIGDDVRLGQYNFSGCGSITGVVISLGAVYEWNAEVFGNCSNLTSIYYGGSWNDWNINGMRPILNGTNANVYYYSESKPVDDGDFWHYDANGNIAVWGN